MDQTLGGARPHPVESDRQRTPALITRDAEQRFQHPAKNRNPRLIGLARPAPVIGLSPICRAERKGPATIQDGDRATAVRSLFFRSLFFRADLHGFHAGLGFGLGLEYSVVNDRGCRGRRLLINNGALLVVASRTT